MNNWDALATAAGASRRLNRCLAGTRLGDEEINEIAAVLDKLVDRFVAGSQRDKLDDMMTRPHLAAIYNGKHTPLDLSPGDEIEFDPFSIAGGVFHPSSIGLKFFKESDDSVMAFTSVDPMFAGPPERVHGGIQALIVDEGMRGRQAFTAYLNVNYRAPAPLNVDLRFRAWVDKIEGRKIFLKATGQESNKTFMDADGLFIAREDQTPDTN
jgi:hypothetical protein